MKQGADTPLYEIMPARPEEEDAFYRDWNSAEYGCIGYYKGDNGRHGDEFHVRWEDVAQDLVGEKYNIEHQFATNTIQNGITRDRSTMREFMYETPGLPLSLDFQGYKLYTPHHLFFLKCFPNGGNDNFYLFIYNREKFEQATGIGTAHTNQAQEPDLTMM